MNPQLTIRLATGNDSKAIAWLADELLQEIMEAMGQSAFNSDPVAIEQRLIHSIDSQLHIVVIALHSGKPVGFCAIAPCYAIYTEGAFGIVSELYVRPAFRSRQIGLRLLEEAKSLATRQGWSRLEVTTPPLPLFQRTLTFYEKEGFSITGGRKLKRGTGACHRTELQLDFSSSEADHWPGIG